LVYWYIVNKTNILYSQKIIKLLHIAPEKNLQKILKSFSHIKYAGGDLNPLMDCDIRLDITDMNFEDFFMNKRTVDPLTQAARLYKATRLPNLLISV
jgi:hypothetical protein